MSKSSMLSTRPWMFPPPGSIEVVGALTRCELLHFVCISKAAQMNVQRSVTRQLMLHEFELGYNAIEAVKNICGTKGKGIVDHCTITRRLKKFRLGCKNLNNQARSNRTKTVNSEAKSGERYSESIEWAQHFTDQCNSLPSWPQQKHLEVPNCASRYQNIAKLLTCPYWRCGNE